ncbi:MAG: hypothetical protein ABSE57_21620 [Bryobacteraceae bacterium]
MKFTSAGDALIAIIAPPLSAAEVNVAVQLDPTVGVSEAGLQAKLLNIGTCSMVTVPPLAEVGIAAPVESADTAFVSWTDEAVSVVEAAKFSVTEAITLFGSVSEFSPHRRQVAVPVPFVQVSDLFAAPAPGTMAADVKSVVE